MHVAVALPVGIEQGRLVGDADVLLESGDNRGIPPLADGAGGLCGIHATAENSITPREVVAAVRKRGQNVRKEVYFSLDCDMVRWSNSHNYRKAPAR